MIYITPHDGVRYTADSTPSGFDSFADVIEVMGPPTYRRAGAISYGTGSDQIMFTPLAVCLDSLKDKEE